mgnify:CR=1 FL=1
MKLFADLLQVYFEEAAGMRGVETESILLDGLGIEFRFAGGRWRHLTRALAHLRTAGGEPDLLVHVWDGERQPANHLLRAYLYTLSNWWFDYVGPRGQLLDVHAPRLQAVYVPGPDLLHVVDLDGNRAYCWKREFSPLPYWETCSPFRPLLHCWLREQGVQFVHAAAVGFPGGGVLLAGQGGAGKSSSALACLDSPLYYLSDDYCAIRQRRDLFGYTVHSLYSTAKLAGEEDLRRFPALAPHVWNPDREEGQKPAFFLHEQTPAKFIHQFPLRALLLPEITGLRETTVEPCRAAEALSALAPSTLSQLPASGAQDLAFLGEVTKRVPAYRLKAGTDIAQIPRAIAALLDSETGRCQ